LGFNGCSVEDITGFAGVPKGSFYNHFESKEDLALEAIESYREAGLHKSLGEQNRSPVKRLKEYFAFLSKASSILITAKVVCLETWQTRWRIIALSSGNDLSLTL
jgi:AcrR family transcriptional regulator